MRTPLLLCLIFAATLATIHGQGPGKAKNSGPLPLQGKSLPDVAAHDESGKEVNLRQQLKGRHGVIVFGCLT